MKTSRPGLYSQGYNWRDEPKAISLSSVVLLLVFVFVAGFALYMVYFQPWSDDSTPPAEPPGAEAQPAPADPAAQPQAAPPVDSGAQPSASHPAAGP